MKLWTDDKASVMEAFISSPAAAPEHHPPRWPPCVNSAASSTATSLAVAHFSPANLQQRLNSLIEGARESWTYAIYWRSSPTAAPLPSHGATATTGAARRTRGSLLAAELRRWRNRSTASTCSGSSTPSSLAAEVTTRRTRT
ncbi:unnamed protein product [Musa acuminata subsp. malaccensis]|uniref:(wild Malaysian banana) hypothetical protein n=1 Tax=Musa acuminata subsp. malaccensis TaxID=214687 RepID=A0A8D7A3Q0_MUSAM|nr:unnamed protein product [Musa acuminata subsp. malaccensis]